MSVGKMKVVKLVISFDNMYSEKKAMYVGNI